MTTRAPLPLACVLGACVLAACVLAACVVDTSLGSHAAHRDSAAHTPEATGGASPSSEDASLHDVNEHELSAPDTIVTPPTEDAAHEQPPPIDAEMSMPDGSSVDEHEIVDASGDQPGEPDAELPHDSGMVVEHPPGCDIATDNMCLTCDQSTCCEQRRSCRDVEACACNLECYYAANPADCRASCADGGEHYQLWLGCLADQCADACPQ